MIVQVMRNELYFLSTDFHEFPVDFIFPKTILGLISNVRRASVILIVSSSLDSLSPGCSTLRRTDIVLNVQRGFAFPLEPNSTCTDFC